MPRTTDPVIIFPAGGGAPADPTASYTYSDPVDTRGGEDGPVEYAEVFPVASGDAVTSWEAVLQISLDGTNWHPYQAVEEQSSGSATKRGTVFSLEDLDGTPLSGNGVPFSIVRGAWRYFRWGVKRTGGGAGSLMQARVATSR